MVEKAKSGAPVSIGISHSEYDFAVSPLETEKARVLCADFA